jgi:regulatory protein
MLCKLMLHATKPSILIPVRLWHKSGTVTHNRSPCCPRPLDPASLEALAIRYVARYATTRTKLTRYLVRKIRERGWTESSLPPIEAIVDRCVANGFVDDRAFAEMRAASLARRGYGHRRVVQALQTAGIAREVADELAPDRDAAFAAAESYARRRRFGIFGTHTIDQATRARQISAMLRAGHGFELARYFVEAGHVM